MTGFDTLPGDPVARVRVALAERSYDILIANGLRRRFAAEIAAALPRPRAIVVTDETVAGHYLAPLESGLAAAGVSVDSIVLPPGEETKSFAHLERLTAQCLDLGLERRDTLFALGGGVIGDLAGFAAAILLRGVGCIQLPTTLLAQVDSSVGGKTAIDMPGGKNLVGAFHQPGLVLIDPETLDTLDRRQRLAGYAETVKYGLIRDRAFFEWLEANGRAVVDGGGDARVRAIETACAAKADVVARDEREAGERALLNLGHTFAHALETATGYSDRLLHGEAVAIGMCMAFDLSAALGWTGGQEATRVRAHLEAVGLPTAPAAVEGLGLTPAAMAGQRHRD
ncbi:MAG: 3-dehydroquinate synthase [Rhodospirillaceae bacterium]|nr:3-dehydroquinate synthase [Rhodospirillaceae bacterium]